jgi:hypothetical protein
MNLGFGILYANSFKKNELIRNGFEATFLKKGVGK